MARFKFLAIKTRYWKPNEDYTSRIISAIKGKVQEGDIIVLSEKAISTALGNIVDESLVKPKFLARLLAKFLMRYIWAYLLGPLCHLRKETINHFKNYPYEEGSAHKQLALQQYGFFQALRHSSEGGIDSSNLPYAYVSLPLQNPDLIANHIRRYIRMQLGKNLIVIIADSDRTYSWRNFHFTPALHSAKGIFSLGGVISYILGRSLKLKRRATPSAVAGAKLDIDIILEVAEIANRTRGFGAGRTVWEMAKNFSVALTNVSWKMLEKINHKPIIIIRSKQNERI